MPFRYSPEFRRKVLDLVAAGRSVASIAADLGVSDQSIYTWRKQELIDTGQQPGLTSVEAAERGRTAPLSSPRETCHGRYTVHCCAGQYRYRIRMTEVARLC